MRVTITKDPYPNYRRNAVWESLGEWPASWVAHPAAEKPPFVCAYRLKFSLEQARTVRAHVSADERYELYLDGKRVGRGSERGSPLYWYYETYDLALSQGDHTLVARVWSLGDAAPWAQMSAEHGWLFAPDDEDLLPLLATGQAPWEAKLLPGYSFTEPDMRSFFVTGHHCTFDAKVFPWGFETGSGDDWQPVITIATAVNHSRYGLAQTKHELVPATLPAMLEAERLIGKARFVENLNSTDTTRQVVKNSNNLTGEVEQWNTLLKGEALLTIPAHTTRRVIVDLENYYCAYPQLVVSGGEGGEIRLGWAESLCLEPHSSNKGNRDEIEGKVFTGIYDTFRLDGGANRLLELLWWRAGRYQEILIHTAEQPVTIQQISMIETRYPLEMESRYESDDPRFEQLTQVAVRALQMCSHETYMDCPYYEQLMYVGDTRLEALVTYAITRDDRLPRKALRSFDVSRILSGLTQSRFPSRITQIIPPFSLWWVGMVHDYALFRGDPDFIRSLMPGVRAVIQAFRGFQNADGLVEAPRGWNFMDWTHEWVNWGVPPQGNEGVSGLINWQFTWILRQAAELEDWVGDPEYARLDRRLASEMSERCETAFWNEQRGLYADDLAHTSYSEHTQCLAVLSGLANPQRQERVLQGLLTAPDLVRTTIYFMHYLFETYYQAGAPDALFDRMDLWFQHPVMGMKTTLEKPEPSRSDCHAWGAHPVFHYFATFLGIRPVEMGFRKVRIAPMPGAQQKLAGTLVHPLGEIQVSLTQMDGKLCAEVSLPEGVSGEFAWQGQTVALKPGAQQFEI